MTRRQRNLWLLATIAFAVCLTMVAFSYIVMEPWRILPDIGGDGAKNNFTYLFHSMYGKGYLFEGMNYPYGEHIVFTDGIPLLSVFFASIGNVTAPVALAVLWWLVGISYVLSVVYIYKILLRFGLQPLYAMIFAGLISILTPQMQCIRGHYALAFTCVIPMLFYWSLVYHEQRGSRYSAYVFIMGCIVSFLHPYYAGMILIWVGAYSLWYFLLTRDTAIKKLKHLLPIFAAGAGVPLVVMTLMKITDKATDRPVSPYTPTDSYANLPQVLSSYFSPFWKFLVEHKISPGASNGGEGYSYLGLVTIGVLCLSVILIVYRKVKKTELPVVAVSRFPRVWVVMAFSILIFSMGIPFIWHMQWLMEYLFIFKQFRALGRFVWIFYYIITVYSVVVMYTWFRQLQAAGKNRIAVALMFLAIGVWGMEVRGYMKETRQVAREGAYNYDMVFSTYQQKWEAFLKEHNKTALDFQGILLLPFFHVGTEKIWVGNPGWLTTLGYKASLQLRLPIVDVMMSRSSWGQAQGQVKITAGPYADKPLLRAINSSKPFLLLEQGMTGMMPDQAYLLSASEYIGTYDDCKVYACYPGRIAANSRRYADSIYRISSVMVAADTCIGSSAWYVAHYDNGPVRETLWGAGALPAINGNDSVIATIPVSVASDSELYEYSCWFLLRREDYRSPEVWLDMQDGAGHTIRVEKVNTTQSTDSRDLWFRCSAYFYIPGQCRQIRCALINMPNPAYSAMDELMLRPAVATIISKGRDGNVMVNNHLFKTAK